MKVLTDLMDSTSSNLVFALSPASIGLPGFRRRSQVIPLESYALLKAETVPTFVECKLDIAQRKRSLTPLTMAH